MAQLLERAQPLRPGDIDAALALHGLDDDGGGLVEAGALVLQQTLEPEEVRDLAVEVVVERHGRAVHQRMPTLARLKALPVTASEPSDMPWKALVKETTDSRPFTLRASLSADSTALVPVGPGNMTL